jgi:hypothetical protein
MLSLLLLEIEKLIWTADYVAQRLELMKLYDFSMISLLIITNTLISLDTLQRLINEVGFAPHLEFS